MDIFLMKKAPFNTTEDIKQLSSWAEKHIAISKLIVLCIIGESSPLILKFSFYFLQDTSQGWLSWICNLIVIFLVYIVTFITFPITGWFVLKVS